jgi:hypothetical protein
LEIPLASQLQDGYAAPLERKPENPTVLRFYCMSEANKRSNLELVTIALVPLSVIIKAIVALILAFVAH